MVFLVSGLLVFVAACGKEAPSVLSDTGIVGDTIPVSLTGKRGDALRGKAVFAEREQGHCILCHGVESLDAPFQGNVGPDLTDVGDRLSPAQIRLRIVDYEKVKPDVLMPSYFRTEGLHQVGSEYAGKPALDAGSIEDLVAYLSERKKETE